MPDHFMLSSLLYLLCLPDLNLITPGAWVHEDVRGVVQKQLSKQDKGKAGSLMKETLLEEEE